ncbi:MAG: hypothetical protein ACKOFA_00785 [Rhodoluna sp.]
MGKENSTRRIRLVLKTGSIVFGLSALALIFTPQLFNQLLGFTSTAELEWSMRMIGITLVALSGNMFSVASRGKDETVKFSGWVMFGSAFALGVLTLLIPVPLNWFTITYSVIGFGFSAAYGWAITSK